MKPEKVEKVVKEVKKVEKVVRESRESRNTNKNTPILGFDSKIEKPKVVEPEQNKFANPFGLGFIGSSKVQENRRGKSIRELKPE